MRKALEVPLAYVMTALWPKARMLEVYLNIAQWGPGSSSGPKRRAGTISVSPPPG